MDFDLLAFEEDISRLCGVNTRYTFDERALARAVIAYKGSYLSSVCVKVNILKNVNWTERFIDASQ